MTYLMSYVLYVLCTSSYILCLMSYMSYVYLLMICLSCLMTYVLCLMCLVSYVSRLVIMFCVSCARGVDMLPLADHHADRPVCLPARLYGE